MVIALGGEYRRPAVLFPSGLNLKKKPNDTSSFNKMGRDSTLQCRNPKEEEVRFSHLND